MSSENGKRGTRCVDWHVCSRAAPRPAYWDANRQPRRFINVLFGTAILLGDLGGIGFSGVRGQPNAPNAFWNADQSQTCTELADPDAIGRINRDAIRAACNWHRDAHWNVCEQCLCAVTSELSKLGIDVLDSLKVMSCGQRLEGVLNYANVSRDQAVYMLGACPNKCRITNGQTCPSSCAKNRGFARPFQVPQGYVDAQDYCNRRLQFTPAWETDDM